MDYVNQLIESAKSAYAKADTVLKKARDENRALTSSESQQCDGFRTEANDYQTSAKAHIEQAKAEKGLEELQLMDVKAIPLFGDGAGEPSKKNESNSPLLDRNGRRVYSDAKAFSSYLRKGKSGVTPEERKYLSSTSDSDGGVIVSSEMGTMIITKLAETSKFRPRATVFNMTTGAMDVPAISDMDDPSVIGEGATMTEIDVSENFGKVTFVPKKLGVIFTLPRELLEDAVMNIEQFLTTNFARRFTVKEEGFFLNGTGSYEPLGILEAGFGTHDIETATSGNIIADDLVDIPLMLAEEYRSNAAWIMPTSTMQQIVKLRTREGGAATGQYLWQPSFAAGKPGTIQGYPVIESARFPTPTADGNPILAFGDLSTYFIADRVNLEVRRLEELYALQDKIGILMRRRVDGTPTNKNAFKMLTRT